LELLWSLVFGALGAFDFFILHSSFFLEYAPSIILERDLPGWFHQPIFVWIFKDGKHSSICKPMVAKHSWADSCSIEHKIKPRIMKQYHIHRGIVRIVFATAVICLAAFTSQGSAIYWTLNEVFSTADGSIQFVELTTPTPNPGDPEYVGAYELVNQSGRTFFFQLPYGAPSSTPFLLATPGFSALPGAVPPDVSWLPAGFLSPGIGSLYLEPYGATSYGYGGMFISGSLSWSQLAINGLSSYGPSGVNAGNSPENHAGQTGSINVPDTTSTFTLLFASGLILIVSKRFQKLPKSLQFPRG
jgi:hypothetical protein